MQNKMPHQKRVQRAVYRRARMSIYALFYMLLSLCFITAAHGQGKPQKQAQAQSDDVVRIKSELVQTDVTVIDKQGRFVGGLPREQFELRVNGKLQPVSFFETVMLGTIDEEKPRAPAGKEMLPQPTDSRSRPRATAEARGRTIFFFVDDVHLAPDSIIRARQALMKFVDEEMGQNDQAAIVSTSGQVGFLQQLTGNKAVLRAAIARLDNKRNPETYTGKVPISEYDAVQVAEAHNRELFRYLVEATMAEYQSGDAQTAANMVKNRVAQIAQQSRAATSNTLYSLEGLMRSSAPLPGRKLIFFISDGFITDPRSSNVLDRLRQVTKTAAQVGAVIYTMDARGTFVNTYTDASQNPYPDFTGSVSRNVFAEGVATQEPLGILAEDTGGRAILNSNSFSEGFKRALDESSNYYLLAWRPESETEHNGKARIVVSIKGRPDLKVRVRRGVIESPAIKSSGRATGKSSSDAPEVELLATLGSLYPVRDIPIALSAGYMNTPDKGMQLVASMQIETAALRENASNESQKTEIDVMGVAMDDRGSISSFKQKLTVPQGAIAETERRPFIWNQQLSLPPGLYQVRVAVRDRSSGLTGSAMQWIEIPSITQAGFYMSSIFIGERKIEAATGKETTAPKTVPVSVDRRFARSSSLRFQTYIYNAALAAGSTDVVLQAQVLQNDQPVLSLPQGKPATNGATDLARLSYSGEIALTQLPAGSYTLQISVTDRNSKRSASQQINFTVK